MVPKSIVPLAWKAQVAYQAGCGAPWPEAATLGEWRLQQRCRAACFQPLGSSAPPSVGSSASSSTRRSICRAAIEAPAQRSRGVEGRCRVTLPSERLGRRRCWPARRRSGSAFNALHSNPLWTCVGDRRLCRTVVVFGPAPVAMRRVCKASPGPGHRGRVGRERQVPFHSLSRRCVAGGCGRDLRVTVVAAVFLQGSFAIGGELWAVGLCGPIGMGPARRAGRWTEAGAGPDARAGLS